MADLINRRAVGLFLSIWRHLETQPLQLLPDALGRRMGMGWFEIDAQVFPIAGLCCFLYDRMETLLPTHGKLCS